MNIKKHSRQNCNIKAAIINRLAGQMPAYSQCCHLHRRAETESKADRSKRCQFFQIISFCPPSLLALHLLHPDQINNSNFYLGWGVRFSLLSLSLSSSWESASSSKHKEVTVLLTSLCTWGRGQFSWGAIWRGDTLSYALRSVNPHPTPGLSLSLVSPNSSPSGPESPWRSATYLVGHLCLHGGWNILYNSLRHLDTD